jgi:hypothetical protein
MYYIYALISETDKICYIGQTQNPKTRKNGHKSKPPHVFKILHAVDSKEEAKLLEIYLIEKFHTYKEGWNKSSGGEGFQGYERKGIGGAKKGRVPWNKGKKKCFNEQTINHFKSIRKGRVFSRKLSDENIKKIRTLYLKTPFIEGVGKICKNGKPMSYIQAFSKKYSDEFGVSPQAIKKIILNQCWNDVKV